MLSDLQKKKLTAWFYRLDVDSSESLNQHDFQVIVERISQALSLNPESLTYAYLRTTYASMWRNVRLTDANQDGEVTLDEWLKYHEELIDSESYHDRLKAQFDVLFNLLDFDQNKEISMTEYTVLVCAYGAEEKWAKENFKRLDLNGDGHISGPELLTLMDNFFRSDDPESPGNWFWGPID